jgi:hypothetical protein
MLLSDLRTLRGAFFLKMTEVVVKASALLLQNKAANLIRATGIFLL